MLLVLTIALPLSADTAFATNTTSTNTSLIKTNTTHTVTATTTSNNLTTAAKTTTTQAAGSPATTTTQPSFTKSQINTAAASVTNFVQTNHRLPNYVTISTHQVTMPQFLQLITANLLNINKGLNTPVTLKTVTSPVNTTETVKSGNILKSEYLTLAQTIQTSISSTGKAPSYVNSSLGKIKFDNLVYSYSKILNFQNTNQRLPNYVSVTPWTSISTTTPTTTTTNVQSILNAIGYAEAKFADVQGQSSPTVMAQVGYGDCWADSGWLFNQLTVKGIQTRIMQCTDSSGLYYLHRWVDINIGNGWQVWNYQGYNSQHYGALGSGSFVEAQGG